MNGFWSNLMISIAGSLVGGFVAGLTAGRILIGWQQRMGLRDRDRNTLREMLGSIGTIEKDCESPVYRSHDEINKTKTSLHELSALLVSASYEDLRKNVCRVASVRGIDEQALLIDVRELKNDVEDSLTRLDELDASPIKWVKSVLCPNHPETPGSRSH